MQFTFLETPSQIIEHINKLNRLNAPVVLDLETTGLDTWNDTIEAVVISGLEADSAVMFSGTYAGYIPTIKCPLVLHNFKFDFLMLEREGIRMLTQPIDTMLLHHLHDENKSHKLDDIVQELWGDKYKEEFWSKYENYQDAPQEAQLEYACKDVIYTYKVYEWLWKDLQAQEVPSTLISHVHNLAWNLYQTEKDGIRIDEQYLVKLGAELQESESKLLVDARESGRDGIDLIELRMWKTELDKRKTAKGKAGVKRPEFNFGSSTQLLNLLYKVLKLKPVLDIKTKKPTTSDFALKELESQHPLIPLLRQIRKVQKMHSAFIEGIKAHEKDGKIYPGFNINGCVTGRISANSPNLQQMPAQGEWAKIRGIFIPTEGHKIISCDFSQLEICIAAHYANDPVLLKMVRAGESMHDYTAAATGITRAQAKKMNFTVLYGGGAYKVAHDLGCSVQKAEEYLQALFNSYKGLQRAIDDAHKRVEEGIPIRSVTGRLRHFPLEFGNQYELQRAKRQAFNSLIQGTGADACNMAFNKICVELRRTRRGRGLIVVHDEVLVEALDEHVEWARDMVSREMCDIGKELGLLVPLTVDCSAGMERWKK